MQDVSGAAVSLVIVDNGQIYVGGGDGGGAESSSSSVAMGEVVRWTAGENPDRKLLVLTSSILVSAVHVSRACHVGTGQSFIKPDSKFDGYIVRYKVRNVALIFTIAKDRVGHMSTICLICTSVNGLRAESHR